MTGTKAIEEEFGSIKTTMIEMFDECYVAVTEVVVVSTIVVVATRSHWGDSMQYQEFNNTKPQSLI